MEPKRDESRLELLQGTLDMLILQTLQWGPQHGYSIAQTLRAQSAEALQVETGSLYPALHRLEQAGLLTSHWMTPESGRRRRIYSLTKAGSKALVERRKAWGRFSQAVDTMLGGRRAWPA